MAPSIRASRSPFPSLPPECWSVFAHDEGVYSVDLSALHVASGGEEGAVRVWARADGALLSTLCHHDYIVWHVGLWLDRLVTCSYDCTVAYLSPRAPQARTHARTHGLLEEGFFSVKPGPKEAGA